MEEVQEAYRLSNDTLTAAFESHRKTIAHIQISRPKDFKSNDYTTPGTEGRETRIKYVENLNKKLNKFDDLQHPGKSKVLPVVQGTNESAAWNIATAGFQNLASLDDGFYGSGWFPLSLDSLISLSLIFL